MVFFTYSTKNRFKSIRIMKHFQEDPYANSWGTLSLIRFLADKGNCSTKESQQTPTTGGLTTVHFISFQFLSCRAKSRFEEVKFIFAFHYGRTALKPEATHLPGVCSHLFWICQTHLPQRSQRKADLSFLAIYHDACEKIYITLALSTFQILHTSFQIIAAERGI